MTGRTLDLTDKSGQENILLVGPTGSGKTSLINTLPGKVWVYIFDPNAKSSLFRPDIQGEEWLPDTLELDATIKRFNKDGKPDDKIAASKLEPRVYIEFLESLYDRAENNFFDDFDWVVFDSLTLLQKACHDRQAFINNRYGKPEDRADYRIVGSKMSDMVRSASSEPTNILFTGHIDTWQDETTNKISTELSLSGSAKKQVPLVMSQIWLCQANNTEEKIGYQIQTRPGKSGLQSIRSSIDGLEMFEDVTIRDKSDPTSQGIGRLLAKKQ